MPILRPAASEIFVLWGIRYYAGIGEMFISQFQSGAGDGAYSMVGS